MPEVTAEQIVQEMVALPEYVANGTPQALLNTALLVRAAYVHPNVTSPADMVSLAVLNMLAIELSAALERIEQLEAKVFPPFVESDDYAGMNPDA